MTRFSQKTAYQSLELQVIEIMTTLPLNTSYGNETSPGANPTISDDLEGLF